MTAYAHAICHGFPCTCALMRITSVGKYTPLLIALVAMAPLGVQAGYSSGLISREQPHKSRVFATLAMIRSGDERAAFD